MHLLRNSCFELNGLEIQDAPRRQALGVLAAGFALVVLPACVATSPTGPVPSGSIKTFTFTDSRPVFFEYRERVESLLKTFDGKQTYNIGYVQRRSANSSELVGITKHGYLAHLTYGKDLYGDAPGKDRDSVARSAVGSFVALNKVLPGSASASRVVIDGYTFPESDEQRQAAERELDKAKAKRLFRTGFELYQNGNFKASAMTFVEGLANDPFSSAAHYYLAENLLRLQWSKMAIVHYDLAKWLEPESKEAQLAASALPNPFVENNRLKDFVVDSVIEQCLSAYSITDQLNRHENCSFPSGRRQFQSDLLILGASNDQQRRIVDAYDERVRLYFWRATCDGFREGTLEATTVHAFPFGALFGDSRCPMSVLYRREDVFCPPMAGENADEDEKRLCAERGLGGS